jgi:uncharacterized membrane protein HdeD (DUF308 family)
MILRGILAVFFGIIALRYPSAAAGAFVIVFAVYAFLDAILDFVAAARFGSMGLRWGWYAFVGLISAAAGVVALVYPHLTLLVLVLVVAVRAIMMGFVEMGAAISWKALDHRWLLGVGGALSIVLGVLLVAYPLQGGAALLWAIGIYAIVLGVMMIITGIGMAAGRRRITTGHAAAA